MAEATARKQGKTTDRGSDPWLSLTQAARLLGVSRQTVLERVVAGELTAMRAANRTHIERASVTRALAAK